MFQKITNYFQGRHTTFVLASISIGVGMAWFHRLDANLVTLILGLQTLITAHSTQENYFKKGN
jgi:hypothetical protein